MEVAGWFGPAVIAPQPLLAAHDQPGFAQVGQMPRRFRLRNAQHLDDVADAQFAAAEHVHDPQPGPIGQGPEHHVDAVGSLGFHIRLSEYISWPSAGQARGKIAAKVRHRGRVPFLAVGVRGALGSAEDACHFDRHGPQGDF